MLEPGEGILVAAARLGRLGLAGLDQRLSHRVAGDERFLHAGDAFGAVRVLQRPRHQYTVEDA
jgi:hypothetical protein